MKRGSEWLLRQVVPWALTWDSKFPNNHRQHSVPWWATVATTQVGIEWLFTGLLWDLAWGPFRQCTQYLTECSHQYASSSHFNYKANWALGMFHKLFPTRLAGDAWPYHYKSSSHFFFSFYFSPLLGKLGTRQYFHKVSGREIAQQKSGTKMTLSQYTWKKEYSSTCLSVLHAVTLYVLPVTRQTRH